jgi:hypothetical protein
VGILAISAATIGCAGGQEPTSESIDQTKQLWAKSGIRNYELEWTVTGPTNAHYFVTVRHGEVRAVELVQPDESKVTLHPSDTRFYSVDGLFLTIANELAQLETDQPFGQPKGTRVAMRFKSDPKLGYPLWYHRDVMGTSQSIKIDVIQFTPEAANSN